MALANGQRRKAKQKQLWCAAGMKRCEILHAAAQVCTLLSGLVVQSMALAARPSTGSQAAGVGSEYHILLRKRLRSAELGECRMGVIAARCLIARLAREEMQVCISRE